MNNKSWKNKFLEIADDQQCIQMKDLHKLTNAFNLPSSACDLVRYQMNLRQNGTVEIRQNIGRDESRKSCCSDRKTRCTSFEER